MKIKSHSEAARIPDADQRYLVELGTEKEAEANQCINDAASEVRAMLRPLLAEGSGASANDGYDTTASIVYTFSVTARKAPGMASALSTAIHAYIVNSALGKYYVSVAQGDLAEAHRSRLALELATINNIIYRRKSPSYS